MKSFEYSGIVLEQIFSSECATSFDCGDDDLNEYFQIDSANYRKELLTSSYRVCRKDFEGELPFGASEILFAYGIIAKINKSHRKFTFKVFSADTVA